MRGEAARAWTHQPEEKKAQRHLSIEITDG